MLTRLAWRMAAKALQSFAVAFAVLAVSAYFENKALLPDLHVVPFVAETAWAALLKLPNWPQSLQTVWLIFQAPPDNILSLFGRLCLLLGMVSATLAVLLLLPSGLVWIVRRLRNGRWRRLARQKVETANVYGPGGFAEHVEIRRFSSKR